MQTKNTAKSIYQEIEDIVFVPKKKSRKKILLIILVLILLFGLLGTWLLYDRGYFFDLNAPLDNTDTNSKAPEDKIENITIPNEGEYKFKTKKTFSKKSCGLQATGEEIYTDWFNINGEVWRVKLSSVRVIDDNLSNTRVWYTTSSDPILEGGTYTELGDGAPAYETGTKQGNYDINGAGRYRLRILCWNTDYTIEVQDNK